MTKDPQESHDELGDAMVPDSAGPAPLHEVTFSRFLIVMIAMLGIALVALALLAKPV